MRYLNTIHIGGLCLVFFLALFFIFPNTTAAEEVNTIMTISTFLFAILAGFFISRLSQRYDSMRNEMATEDAYWVAMYRTVTLMGKKPAKDISDIIDRYYMTLYDDTIGLTYQASEKDVHSVYDFLRSLKGKKDMLSQTAVSEIVDILEEVEKGRNQIAVLAEEKMTRGQWAVMLALMTIIILGMFFMDRTSFFMQGSVVLMSTSLVMVLLILKDLQEFRFGGKILLEESGQQVFESLGKLRYYNEAFLKNGMVKVPKHVKKYRLGRVDKNGKRVVKVVNN